MEETDTNVQIDYRIPAGASIGHVHLKVANIPRALDFYVGLLGFDLLMTDNTSVAFISAGGYHHHIGLNTWESAGASPPPKRATGLYHIAVLYPERKDLAVAVKRLLDHGWAIGGASDHGVSEAIYLNDPDENGVELYWDRPRDQWPKTDDGQLTMYTRRLDFAGLLALAN